MIWLIDVSSLVEASLDYTDYDNWILGDVEEEMRQLLVSRLRHVKHLKLGMMLLEVLYRLEAEGFIIPSNIEHAMDDGPKEAEGFIIPSNIEHAMDDGHLSFTFRF
nr:hypothetical protein [Tanacetum cinerariifolium]